MRGMGLRKRKPRKQRRDTKGNVLPRGVTWYARYNIYRVFTLGNSGKRKEKTFRDLTEAITYNAPHERQRVANDLAKLRQTPEERRAHNLNVFGNCSSQEREVAMELKTFVETTEGCEFTITILNDHTRADVLLGMRGCDDYVMIQLKTTGGPMRNIPNAWFFNKTDGYDDMLLVCYRCDKEDAWILDGGSALLPSSGGLSITPGGKHCKSSLGGKPLAFKDMLAVFKTAWGNRVAFPRITLEMAQRDFKSETARIEWAAIEGVRRAHPERDYTDPIEQASTVDQTLLDDRDGRRITAQFKAARLITTKAGFNVTVEKSAGNKKMQPYAVGDFDELIVYYRMDAVKKYIVWHIPAHKLVCLARSETEKGLTGMLVHVKEADRIKYDLGKIPCKDDSKYAFTREYYEII